MDPRPSVPVERDVVGGGLTAERSSRWWAEASTCPSTSPLCQCRTKDDLTGVIAAFYEREQLVWVRYLGGGLDLRACADGLATWEDGVLDGVRRLTRIWMNDGAPLRPLLAETVARGRRQ